MFDLRYSSYLKKEKRMTDSFIDRGASPDVASKLAASIREVWMEESVIWTITHEGGQVQFSYSKRGLVLRARGLKGLKALRATQSWLDQKMR
jgi:hypothetical protein